MSTSAETYLDAGEAFDIDPEQNDPQLTLATRGVAASVRIHDKEIRDIPVLKPEESKRLGVKIQIGNQAQEAVRYVMWAELPIDDDVKEWIRQWDEGDLAKQQLVTGHLRFAAHVARLTMGWTPFGSKPIKQNGESIFNGGRIKNLSKFATASLPLEDRIQEATLGLYEAADKYDPERGSFTTCAMYYMEKSIDRAIDFDRSLKLQLPHIYEIRRMGRTIEKLAQELGRMPSKDEIALEMGITAQGVEQLEHLESMGNPESMEVLAFESSQPDAVEYAVPLADTVTPDEDYYEQIDMEMIADELLAHLHPRDRDVVAMRLGMVGGEPMTLREIGVQRGVTQERIRQIEREALKSLRGHRALQGYSRRGY
jgi:RNA polymerase nonessential primary-like sigma factor